MSNYPSNNTNFFPLQNDHFHDIILKVMDKTEDPNVMKECNRLRLMVRVENAAVSAGGFFFITKDYATTVCFVISF